MIWDAVWNVGMLRVYLDGRLRILTRLDRLAEALDRFLNAKAELIERAIVAETNKVWMSIVLGFGLVMLVIWGFQAVCIALREFGRANGVM